MPTYQYLCTACAHEFEVVQSFSEDSLKECPQCQGLVRKVYNSVGVVFKGSGFYKTDSRSSKSDSSQSSSSTTSATTSASTGKSSDTSSSASSSSVSTSSASTSATSPK